MTIIAAVQAEDGTYIGSDTALTAGDRQLAANYQKWVGSRTWQVGFAGCWKIFNIIQSNKQYIFSRNKSPEDITAKLQEVFDSNDVGKHEDYVTEYGPNLLIARKNGPVFHLDPVLALSEIPKNVLWAEGSGADLALGAGYALSDKPAEYRMKMAIDAAKEYCVACAGQTWINKL